MANRLQFHRPFKHHGIEALGRADQGDREVIMFAALHETGSGTTSGHVCSNDRFWGQSGADMLNSNFSGFDPGADLSWRKAYRAGTPIGGWDAPAIARSRYAGDAARYPRMRRRNDESAAYARESRRRNSPINGTVWVPGSPK
jgi:hypothetical protein